MHEQSIVESLLDLALKKAVEAKAKKILRIYLVVGELCGVVESVNLYFSFLRKNTIAAGAGLFFTRTADRFRCRKCDTVFSPGRPGLPLSRVQRRRCGNHRLAGIVYRQH